MPNIYQALSRAMAKKDFCWQFKDANVIDKSGSF